MEFLAHIRKEPNGKIVRQTVEAHCRNTATYAQACLEEIGLGETAYLAGLLHDMGKCKQEFDTYLHGKGGVKGSVNHTFAACRYLMERFHDLVKDPFRATTAELLTVAVGGHHGLFDLIDENGHSGFLHRMQDVTIGYDESFKNFFNSCVSEVEIEDRFAKAVQEVTKVCDKLAQLTEENISDFNPDSPKCIEQYVEENQFLLGMCSRLLLSAVIEGDRRDTAAFMRGHEPQSKRTGNTELWSDCLEYMENKLKQFDQNTEINKARSRISEICRMQAEKAGSIYRLNVPTGGSKTLSSLRFALAHAKRWGKQRLIFTSPLLSILEQNAEVLRNYLGDDSIVLEHHSNMVQTEERGELDVRELSVESWDAPVIITTLVQFLNTLFDGKTTAIRRFQALCGSVIVIDEVQTVPFKMLSLFNLTLNFLTEVCGATVVLCSATQPCLEENEHPLRRDIADIVPFDAELWKPFARTDIVDAGQKTMDEIAVMAAQMADEVQSLLVICNRKDEAEYLFNRLCTGKKLCVHLSASMCQAHRKEAVARLYDALEKMEPCICVSTQVIEAGVDISFGRVIRLTAGMDNIIQAAGRCNRNGEYAEEVPVYIAACLGEDLRMLPEIKAAKDASLSLLNAYARTPEQFDHALSSDKAIAFYYRKLFGDMPKGYQNYSIPKEKLHLFDLMSCNWKYMKNTNPAYGRFIMNQASKTAGRMFTVFDQDSVEVIVPYGEGKELIAELVGYKDFDSVIMRKWSRRARPWTVSVYSHQIKALGEAVQMYHGVAVLADGFYDENIGLQIRGTGLEFLEV